MDQQIIFNFAIIVVVLIICWIIHLHYSTEYKKERHLLEEIHKQQQKHVDQLQQQLQQREQDLIQAHTKNNNTQSYLQQLEHCREENKQLSRELRNQLEINRIQEAELREATIRLEENRTAAEDKQRLLINSEQRLITQFENLANRIFENNYRRVEEQNRQSFNNFISPLQEQLEFFRRQINDSFGQEARERYSLTHEIKHLQKLNSQIAQEAINLTKALKGNNKIQGAWGEVVLSKLLESSGLRKGYEYDTQVSIQLEETQGRMQPDVIIRLPQGKDVVIDAKMALVAYERYFNSEDENIREKAIQEHLNSVRSHIRLLGQKDYQKLPGLRTLDYVLMFIPIEPAFLLAINHQPELIGEALKQNIMLVSPTTLMVALRTINNLWRYENQSRNAQRIADRAARLYDKIRLFVDDMTGIGNYLDKAQKSYHLAMKKLIEGRGNIIAQSEAFRSLGVEIKESINSQIVGKAQSQLDKEEDNRSLEIEKSNNDTMDSSINTIHHINGNE